MSVTRPPRTEAHRLRDTYLQQFADLGLQPILSTNGNNPEADIQFVKVPADEAHSTDELHGGIECWITTKGLGRLYFARNAYGMKLESA